MTISLTRGSAKRISVFNHKGGVGKTTLTYNIAAAIAAEGKTVLLVDSDPQCNLTAYLIDEQVLDDLLDKSDSDNGQTIWSAVRPLVESTGPFREISAFELPTDRLYLLPGDIRLSDFEEQLNDYWGECFQRKRRGFKGTMALSELIGTLVGNLNVDFVFYDSGPNIGPLNRVILLDCDYFIVPAAYDLFSVRAMKTLGRTLVAWTSDWETIQELAPEDTYVLPGKPQFLGYIPQNFSVYRGTVSSEPAKYAGRLDRTVQSDLVGMLRLSGLVASTPIYKLGEAKDFGALVTASQRQGVPLWDVTGAGTPDQRSSARSAFRAIASQIIERTET